MDATIFGLRFNSNHAVHPAEPDLDRFLETRIPGETRKKHGDDLANYVHQARQIGAFLAQKHSGMQISWSDRKYLGILAHSQFFKHALRSAVAQFKYHNHTLATLDFRKPQAFVLTAQQEIGRLNPKKKDEQARIIRLRSLIDQRTTDIAKLREHWFSLDDELRDIAVYIGDNLERIQRLCESCIVVLAGIHAGGEKRDRLIEDIKTHFKEQVRDHLDFGSITQEHIDSIKSDVENLSEQLSQRVREDIYDMTMVFEKIYEHAKNTAGRLREVLGRAEGAMHKNLDKDRELFGKIEQILAELMTNCDFRVPACEEPQTVTGHDRLLFEKRREMFDHVFELLRR